MNTNSHSVLSDAFRAALPVMLGYITIGLPCGVLLAKVGLAPWMCLLMSCTFYSGAGQFMLSNLWLAGSSVLSIITSISFVNTRQMLYSASFAPYFANVNKLLSFLFAASVTDESFGVNMERFSSGEPWDAQRATLVNFLSMFSWTMSNFVGALVGELVSIPVAITSFAMTSIFICLLVCQPQTATNRLVAVCSAAGVVVCKLVGLSGPAILLGALFGIGCGIAYARRRQP